jgi:DNA polymerase-3 subunit alpha (Gram-positive type)
LKLKYERCDKSLAEKFSKYEASGIKLDFLETLFTYKCLVNKEKRSIMVYFYSETLVPRSLLFEIEKDIAKAYELSSCFFMPSYPDNLFTPSYFSELVLELSRNTAVANGFFDGGRMEIAENKAKVYLKNGLGKIPCEAECTRILEDIVKAEFDKSVKFEIIDEDDFNMEAYIKESEAHTIAVTPAPLVPEEKQLEKVLSLMENEEVEESVQDGEKEIFNTGFMSFDITCPELVYGKEVKNRPLPTMIKNIYSLEEKALCTVVGRVFFSEDRETRSGEKIIATIQITDDSTSATMKIICAVDKFKEAKDSFKVGNSLMVVGQVDYDTFDKETVIKPRAVYKVKSLDRCDDAEEKRVELHLHTTLSAMDAVIPPDVIVKTAHKWGHRAVAITDHGNVQGFPEAMLAAEKLGMKVIYGLEAYFVDDTARAVFGEATARFDKDDFVVFDIETTGLSPLTMRHTLELTLKRKGFEPESIEEGELALKQSRDKSMLACGGSVRVTF